MSPKRSMLAAFGGLAVVLALAFAGCTNPSSSATTGGGGGGNAPGGTAVSISNFAFSPATISVKVGTTVTWTNNDSAPHTITADDGSFDSGEIAQGKSYSHAFSSAGTFTYHCSVHPFMKASVVVTP